MDCRFQPEGPQIWKQIFMCGTELEQLEQVQSIKWDFSHLDEEIQTGRFSVDILPEKDSLYCFGCTEPQMILVNESTTVVPIPVIVAVQTAIPLPEKLGLKSVQMESEQIVDMRKFKMGWSPLSVPKVSAPRPPDQKRRRRGKIPPPRWWGLTCSQRKGRGVLKNLNQERTRQFDYCMPYISLPAREEEQQQDTTVDVMCSIPGLQAPLVFDFDWDMDDAQEMAEEKVKDEKLDANCTDVLVEAIEAAVSKAKAERRAEREARKRAMESVPAALRAALADMRIFKFYPKNEQVPRETQSKYINRYYGQAHLVL